MKKNKLDIDKLRNVFTNLSNLKSKVDKLDVDKFVPVPVNLNKLSDIVKNYVIKKDVYNTNAIEDKIPDITNLATPFFFINMTENSLQPRLCLAFVKETDFDNKLKNLNKNELNELSKMLKQYQQKD